MRPIPLFLCALVLAGASPPALRGEAQLVAAFAFGARDLQCASANEPSTNYTMVLQGTPAELEYSAARGWGYEITNPGDSSRSGYGQFGPFDDSANLRDAYSNSCPTELYDSFIGAKDFATACSGSEPCPPPEGIIFRVDVPDGSYRFVAAVGSSTDLHTHRVVVEDGGSGPPANIGPNNAVLVHNFDQGLQGAGVFARVGFDGFLPPDSSELSFVDMGADGRETAGAAESPTLEVTSGYLRVHQLQAASGGADPNGSDLVILELWREDSSYRPIRKGSTWKFTPGLQEASSPDITAWRLAGFDDASWPSGPTPVGYGEAGILTDLSLLSPPMQSNYTSVFLRQSFELTDPLLVNQLEALTDYDDGLVLWINGVEVLRLNVDGLDGSPVYYDDLATTGHESGLEEGYSLPEPSGYLLPGTNVVAAQVFNTSITSSDLKFDLEVYDPVAPDLAPPSVTVVSPAPGVTVSSLSEIRITFDEPVTGVDAADLLINGAGASAVTGSGPGPFVFSFPEPPPGTVAVSWAASHGISDEATPPNAFTGGSFSYTLDPNASLANVRINELVAINRNGLLDEDGEASDWIEFYNADSQPVDMTGWSLTDDEDEDGKWVFPGVVLAPGEFLVVFASEKDRRPVTGELHTNFKLGGEGEYLALLDAESPRRLVSEFAPRFPRQAADISYGRDGSGTLGYFDSPTPGSANGATVSFDGFVLRPRFTPERGFYDSPMQVTISSVTAGASIRYTLDGSEPGESQGTPYGGPITVQGTTDRGVVTIRAVAYASGLLPSDVVTHSYIFTEDVVRQPADPAGFPATWNSQTADYEMDARVVDDPGHAQLVRDGLKAIPTLSIVMDVDDLFGSSNGFYANPSQSGAAWERPCSTELIYPDAREGFQVNCGIRAQGGSSVNNWKVIKISMRLLFKGDYGPTKLRFPLFPDDPVEEFNTLVLDAHMNQTWQHPNETQRVRADYIRDVFMSDLQRATGGPGVHDIWMNVYLNGLYWGMFDIHERPDAAWAASQFGGDETEYDALKHNGSTVVDGNTAAWNSMISLANQNLSSNANYLALQDYLEMPPYIDYMIANQFGGNDDWDHHNWYATRRRTAGSSWLFHSWDAEHTLKSITIDRTNLNNTNQPSGILTDLRSNAEFRLLFADRVHRQFFGGGPCYVDPSSPAWDPANPERNRPADLYMQRVYEIDSPIACEAARWGDTRRPSEPYTRNDEWATEINWIITQYFEQRSAQVLEQFRAGGLYPALDAPVFNRDGGRVSPGFGLTMSLPPGTSGTIYFTTNGVDPRVFGSGAVSASASPYSGALTISSYTHVKARVLNGSTWSALSEGIFVISDPGEGVVISEIMYHPLDAPEYEFVELMNTGALTSSLAGLRFSSGITYVFSEGQTIPPGGRFVLAADAAAFSFRYPGVTFDGVFLGQLANGGERLSLSTEQGALVSSVEYDDDGFWPLGPDILGHSLVLVDPQGDPDSPSSWRASADVHGSPGAADPPAPPGGVIINEVLARSTSPFEDAVELYNPTSLGVDVSGWYLSDSRLDATSLQKYAIPAGTVIPPGGYAVLYQVDFADPGLGSQAVDLGDLGGAVYLSGADGVGNLTGYVVGAEYDAEEHNVSFGRIGTSTGEDFGALSFPSFGVNSPASLEEFRSGTGSPNAPARFGPLVLNEIMYNPAAEEEFVELYNPTFASVPLYDPGIAAGWRIGGILNDLGTDDYEFPAGAEVPARGFLLAVQIDPSLFRSLHNVPAAVPIWGPYGGALDNGGERLKLIRPGAMSGPMTPLIVVDQLRYNDRSPWPTAADGAGPSLERVLSTSYGNDAGNWQASSQPGGTPGLENTVTADPCLDDVDPPSASCPALLSATPPRCPAYIPDVTGLVLVSDNCTVPQDLVVVQSPAAGTAVGTGVHTITITVTDAAGNSGGCSLPFEVRDHAFIRGNINNRADHILDIGDAVDLVSYLFAGFSPGFDCAAALDVDNDGLHNITDVVALIQGTFQPGLYTIPPPGSGAPDIAEPDGGAVPSELGCNEGETCL